MSEQRVDAAAERDEALAAAAVLREALTEARNLFDFIGGDYLSKADAYPDSATQEAMESADHALSTDAGAGLLARLAKAEQERDGYRNGQLQVQAIYEGIYEVNTKIAAELSRAQAVVEAARAWRDEGDGMAGGEPWVSRLVAALAAYDAAGAGAAPEDRKP